MKTNFLIALLLMSLCPLAQTKKTYTYALKNGENLELDVYIPTISDGKRPFFVWVHGGGFAGGSKDGAEDAKVALKASQMGYVGVSVGYRLSRKGDPQQFGCDCPLSTKLETFEMAVEDFLDAVLFLQAHASDFNGDTTKIIIGGSSAGAETVLNAAYMREYFVKNKEKYESISFSGVLSLAGAMVQSDYIQGHNAIPAILVHGTEDNLVPYGTSAHHGCAPNKPGYMLLNGSQTIAEKLDSLETSYWLETYPNAKHEVASFPMQNIEKYLDFITRVILPGKKEQLETVH